MNLKYVKASAGFLFFLILFPIDGKSVESVSTDNRKEASAAETEPAPEQKELLTSSGNVLESVKKMESILRKNLFSEDQSKTLFLPCVFFYKDEVKPK